METNESTLFASASVHARSRVVYCSRRIRTARRGSIRTIHRCSKGSRRSKIRLIMIVWGGAIYFSHLGIFNSFTNDVKGGAPFPVRGTSFTYTTSPIPEMNISNHERDGRVARIGAARELEITTLLHAEQSLAE